MRQPVMYNSVLGVLLSTITGWVMGIWIPPFLRKGVYFTFASIFGVNLLEVEQPLVTYPTINAFFTRSLIPKARPIYIQKGAIICPVDGLLLASGKIELGRLIQAKGVSYSVETLLGSFGSGFKSGFFFTFYLSPKDCHRIFSPVKGSVVEASVIPGRLFPVREPYISQLSGLYTRNERMVTIMSSELGRVGVVMVGAFNVGAMDVTYDSTLKSDYFCSEIQRRFYPDGPSLSAGDWLGTFHLGSTVVLLIEHEGFDPLPELSWGRSMCYGQCLGWVR